MNQLYKVAINKMRNPFSKKLVLILFAFIGIFGAVKGQNVLVTGSISGGPTSFATLKLAFDGINAGTFTGNITVSITGNTTETATAILNSSSLPSNYLSVTITPNAMGRVITGNLSTGIVKLLGADNVLINGDFGGARGLTFSNSNPTNSSPVMWVGSASSTDGANNNTIKNCIVTGSGATATLVGIVQSSGTTAGGFAETANSNNTYSGNLVSQCQFGIGAQGASAAGNEDINTQILSNKVLTLGRVGVFVASQKAVVVSKDTITGVNSNLGNFTIQNSGILVSGTMVNGLIEKNDISNIAIVGFWGCNGIQLDATNTSTNLVIANNFIYNIWAGGFPFFDSVDDNGTGIAVDAGGGYLIEYNSIHLNTNQPQAGITAAIWFSSGIPAGAVTLKNNIFSNQETTSTRYSIYTNTSTNALFASINNNDYYTNQNVGFLTTARTSLANWQAVSGGDAASVAVNPNFVNPASPWNLHVLLNSPLEALGTPIAGITVDIDNDIRNATTPDIGADEFIPLPCNVTAGGTASASTVNICASGSAVLSATGYSYGLNTTYQWQWSSSGLPGTWNTLAGQTNPLSGNTGTIVATTYYQLLVTCTLNANTSTSNTIQINVNNPAVSGASASPNPRCGVGTVTLSATGTNLQWYTAASGGTPFATGSPVTSPIVYPPTYPFTQNFYVSASSPGTNCTAGKSGTTGGDGGFNGTDVGLVFDAIQPFTLLSVKMYPQAAGTVTIQAVDNTGALIPGCQQNVTFAGATSTGVVVPLSGFTFPIGNGHRLILSSNPTNMSIWRDFAGVAYPYPICTVGTITGGWISGSTTAYYYFYDWQTTTRCESNRTAVPANFSAPPAFATFSPAAGAPRVICQGGSVNLSATGGGYTTYTWNPGNLPNPSVVSPTVTTTYTLTADIPGGCRRDSVITITVNSTPTAITVNPVSASVCPNTPTAITTSGGVIPGQSIYSNDCETASPFGFTLTNIAASLVNVSNGSPYVYQGAGSIRLTHGDFSNGAIQSPNIPLTGYTSPTLSFYHIAGLEATSTNHYDVGYVEYATTASPVEGDWIKFPASTVATGPSLIGGVAGYDNTSYPDWDAQFSTGASTPGIAPAASMWKHESINLSAWQGFPNFRIRFHVVTDVSIQYYGWLIDSITIKGTGQAPITWSPVTNLYTNIAGTIPYVACTNSPTVYFNPAGPVAPVTYTATAANGLTACTGCTSTVTTTLSASSLAASVSITQNPAGTICGGQCVTFTAAPTNGGAPPAYQWFVDPGTTIFASQGPSTVGANTFTTCSLQNGWRVKCEMSVNPNVGACIVATVVTSNIITMAVNPKPTATPITGGTTVCNGSSTVLTETPVGTVTNYQWFLDSGSGPVSIQNGAGNTYNATLPGIYSVIVTSNLGCKDTSANLVVTLPTYTITATAGPNGTISPSGAVVVNCGSSQVFTFTPNSGYLVDCVSINGGPCLITPPTTYTFNNVTGDSTIDVTFQFPGCSTPVNTDAGPDGSTCGTTAYTLTGASISGGPLPGVTTGTWTSSGTGTFLPNNNFPGATTYTPSSGDVGTVVTLTLSSVDPTGPCPASSSSMLLTVKATPAVTITGKIGICASPGLQTTILVADTSATTVNVTSFQWYHPFPTTIGTNNDSLSVASGATGNYSVIVTGANGCTATNAVTVNVFANPTVSASGLGPICTDAGVDINATATVSGSGSPIVANGYQWYNGGPISGANLSILTATSAGNYQVTASDANGCISALSTPVVSLAMDNSPLIGLYTIGNGPASCTNYISFARAIRDLNIRGISGSCIFTVQAGYTETVPFLGLKLGSALLNPQTAGAFTITFSKSGVGNNPKLTAYTGGIASPTSAWPDGIWAIRGTNNVNINGIDLEENASNTGFGLMEYGYGIFRYTTTDGGQNNSIQNCKITLNKANSAAGAFPTMDGSVGIIVAASVDTNAVTLITPASVNGTNSNNKFYGNTVSNCHTGIGLSGYAAPTPFTLGDTNNDVGGTSATTGNTIINFGNTGDATSALGVRVANQWGANVSFNTIRNNNWDGAGVNTNNNLIGIRGEASAANSASITFSGNVITLSSASAGGQSVTGIDNAIGTSASGNQVLILDNIITDSATASTAAVITGIVNSGSAATVSISNNTVRNCTFSGTGSFTGITNTGTPTNLILNSNTINNNKKNGTGNVVFINIGSPTNSTISSNIITNNTVTGGALAVNMTCMQITTSNYLLDGNTVYNNFVTGMSGTAVTTLYGFNTNASGALQETLQDNVFRKLFVTGTSSGNNVIQGFRNITSSGASHFRIVQRNTIDSLYTSSGMSCQITAIHCGTGFNVTIAKNKIHSLWPGFNAAATNPSYARGIVTTTAAGTQTAKISNNIISLDLTQAAAPAGNGVLTNAVGVAGIDVQNIPATTTINIYYNTIRLAGAGAAGFGSAGIYLSNPNPTQPTVDMRNNIVANYATPNGGLTVALRRGIVAMTGYALTSNNNLWYTTQTPTTPIYHNGTAAFQTLALFKTNVSTRETFSIGDNPVFVSIPLNDLHLDPANNCNIDGAGTPIATYTDDYDADVRDLVLPDIGMDEFHGTGSGFTWKGLNTDWLNAANWCGGVPTATDDVVIPAGKSFYPIIVSAAGLAVAHNIDINLNANIMINNGGVLSNTGSWTNNGTLTNNGMIVLNGTVNQTFPGGGTGTMPTMDSIMVNNAGGAIFNKPFTIIGMLKPKAGNIAVNDVVTLHSDLSGTARVDTVQGSFTYSGPGKFIVERYISTLNPGPDTTTAWRFLSIPTNTTETINQAWMEGMTPGVTFTPTGFGTIVVGPGGTGVGFDQATTTPSMKTYATATNTWVSVPNTSSPIATSQGYMIFLRGDRSANTFGSANATTLRTRGPIKTGNVTVSTANGNLNTFISTGNPYPSAISFASSVKTGLQNVYYLWDPKLSTYGAYVAFTFNGTTYVPSPATGSYLTNNAIESGQAFFVISSAINTPHSFMMTETSKVPSNVQVARSAAVGKQLVTNLYLVTGTGLKAYDGNRIDFDPAYSKVVDDDDARKMTNFGENLGIMRDGISLIVERHPEIVDTDTLFYQLGQMRQQQYQLEFIPENMSPLLTAYFEDGYLHTSTPVSMQATSTVNFTVNADPASKAADRFRIVFKQLGPVPLSFTSITANKQGKDVLVSWRVSNELNIANYVIEHSADGLNFSQLGTQPARNNGGSTSQGYNLLDVAPFTGDNFYRVKSIGNAADVKYSEIVKVNMKGDPSMITVYPNPVKEDGIVKVNMSNQPEGQYKVQIFNEKGQKVFVQPIIHAGGNSVYTLELKQSFLTHGNYMLQVVEGNKVKTTFKIVY